MENKYETELLNHLSNSDQIRNYNKVILFIILFIVIIISMSSIISYPEKIEGKVFLLSDYTPNTLYSPNSGNINLLINENETIKKDKILAYISTDTSYKDYIFLKKEISNFNIYNPYLSDNFLLSNLKLGILDESFNKFILSYREYINFKESRSRELNKIKLNDYILFLQKELEIRKKYLKSQQNINNVINEIFRDDSLFYTNKVIQKEKYNTSLLNQLDVKSKKHLDLYNIISINKEIKDNANQINILDEEYRIQEKQLLLNIHKSFLDLKMNLENWEYNFLIKSPIDGKIEFLQLFINNSQHISKNTPIFIILPKYNKIEGKGIVSPYGYAKIKLKDSIIIKLDNYPFQEFGVINGIINNKSDVLNDSVYTIDIGINRNLVSSYNKRIHYSYNMTGKIEYYTEKTTILEKILFFLKSIKKQ